MEKDNKAIKNLLKLKDCSIKIFLKVFNIISKIYTKLISQVHFLDPKDNTKQRIVTSIILLPIAIYAIFFSKSLFILLAITITILMTWEWSDITKTASKEEKKKWQLIGFFYILIPIYSVIEIRFSNIDVLFWMFAVIWATDIFAFFSGKMLGGAKLAPSISPNKTWSGLIGGIIASVSIGLLSSLMFKGGIFFFMFFSMLISILEQISDLLESKIKRIFNVKDSGNIIPGHGGVLDRLDGMILVAPFVLLLTYIFSDKF